MGPPHPAAGRLSVDEIEDAFGERVLEIETSTTTCCPTTENPWTSMKLVTPSPPSSHRSGITTPGRGMRCSLNRQAAAPKNRWSCCAPLVL